MAPGKVQTTLDRGRAPPTLKQARHMGLTRSLKVLQNIDKSYERSLRLDKLQEPSGQNAASGSKRAEPSRRAEPAPGGKSGSSWVTQFRPLGKPLKATVTSRKDGKEDKHLGYGIAAFAPEPSPKRPPNSIDSGADVERPSKRPRPDATATSAAGEAHNTSSASSVKPPPAPIFSKSAALSMISMTSKSGLKDPTNPITHSTMYSRTQHYVSASTGHQQSNRAGSTLEGDGNWMKMRAKKLQQQAEESVSQQDQCVAFRTLTQCMYSALIFSKASSSTSTDTPASRSTTSNSCVSSKRMAVRCSTTLPPL